MAVALALFFGEVSVTVAPAASVEKFLAGFGPYVKIPARHQCLAGPLVGVGCAVFGWFKNRVTAVALSPCCHLCETVPNKNTDTKLSLERKLADA